MSQTHDHEAGYKHRSTDKFLKYFKQEVMDMCHREGLHQIDLLQSAEVKITQAEYMAKRSGQEQLEKINQKIVEDGLTPTSTVFQTQKQYLRNAIDECAALFDSFEEFQSNHLTASVLKETCLKPFFEISPVKPARPSTDSFYNLSAESRNLYLFA